MPLKRGTTPLQALPYHLPAWLQIRRAAIFEGLLRTRYCNWHFTCIIFNPTTNTETDSIVPLTDAEAGMETLTKLSKVTLLTCGRAESFKIPKFQSICLMAEQDWEAAAEDLESQDQLQRAGLTDASGDTEDGETQA